jgi:hypothetical protein
MDSSAHTQTRPLVASQFVSLPTRRRRSPSLRDAGAVIAQRKTDFPELQDLPSHGGRVLAVAVDPKSAECAIVKADEHAGKRGTAFDSLLPLRIPLWWYPGFAVYGYLPHLTTEDLIRTLYRDLTPSPRVEVAVHCHEGDLEATLAELLRTRDYGQVVIGCASSRRRMGARASELLQLAQHWCPAEIVC